MKFKIFLLSLLITSISCTIQSAAISEQMAITPHESKTPKQSIFYKPSAMHLAVILNDAITIKSLLQEGFDANIQDEDGNAPLHYAVHIKDNKIYYEITTLLWEYNADPHLINQEGISPLQAAHRLGVPLFPILQSKLSAHNSRNCMYSALEECITFDLPDNAGLVLDIMAKKSIPLNNRPGSEILRMINDKIDPETKSFEEWEIIRTIALRRGAIEEKETKIAQPRPDKTPLDTYFMDTTTLAAALTQTAIDLYKKGLHMATQSITPFGRIDALLESAVMGKDVLSILGCIENGGNACRAIESAIINNRPDCVELVLSIYQDHHLYFKKEQHAELCELIDDLIKKLSEQITAWDPENIATWNTVRSMMQAIQR